MTKHEVLAELIATSKKFAADIKTAAVYSQNATHLVEALKDTNKAIVEIAKTLSNGL